MMTETQNRRKELLREIDIHELLPQKEPFVMISNLIHFDEQISITETIITPENIFVENGILNEFGLIENIAQTCAARMGYLNKYILKKEIRIGFIGAIRNMEIMERPKIGDVITTTIEIQGEIFGMTLVKATVTCDNKIIVKAEMKTAVKEGDYA